MCSAGVHVTNGGCLAPSEPGSNATNHPGKPRHGDRGARFGRQSGSAHRGFAVAVYNVTQAPQKLNRGHPPESRREYPAPIEYALFMPQPALE